MSENCDAIAIFLIYSQFGKIRKPDSGCIVCKTYIFIKITFYLTKTENRTNKYHRSHSIALSNGTILAKKNAHFWQKYADISKIKKVIVLKYLFAEAAYVCVLCAKFEVFSIILTGQFYSPSLRPLKTNP